MAVKLLSAVLIADWLCSSFKFLLAGILCLNEHVFQRRRNWTFLLIMQERRGLQRGQVSTALKAFLLQTISVRGCVFQLIVSHRAAPWPSGLRAGLRRRRARVQIPAATLSGNSLRQTVRTHCVPVH